jgi:hypothetical protein
MKKIYLILLVGLFVMCKTDREIVGDFRANAPLIIYKTKADYSNNVPITMNDSKELIVSYPSPKDVFFNSKLALPEKLNKGYLFDNVGVSKNSVFTSYTFKEYAKLEMAPSIEELLKSIIDKDPFVEVYDCGTRGKYSTVDDLKKLIKSKFDGCNRLK